MFGYSIILFHRYASRPQVLENMCLAEFSATYTTRSRGSDQEGTDHIPDDSDDNDADVIEANDGYPDVINLNNDLGYMTKRKRHCIIR